MIHIPSKPGDKIVITQEYLDSMFWETGYTSKFSDGDVVRIVKVDDWMVYGLWSKYDIGQQDGTWDSFFSEEEIHTFQLRVRADQLDAIRRKDAPNNAPPNNDPDHRGRR